MGCTNTPTLNDITFSCEDIPVGGLKTVFVAHKSKVTVAFDVTDTNLITAIAFDTPADVVKLDFNNKDAFSNFTDVKTVDPTGAVATVPTISVEFPKMTKEKRDALNELASAGLELIAFIQDSADVQHMVGYDYGLIATSVNGQTGTGRSEKNMYQLTLTGDESVLAYDIDSTVWATIIAAWETV